MLWIRFPLLLCAVALFFAFPHEADALGGCRAKRLGNRASCSGQSRARVAIRMRGTGAGYSATMRASSGGCANGSCGPAQLKSNLPYPPGFK